MPVMKTAYHIGDGAKEMYAVDADMAVRAHPTEWSFAPWDIDESNAYRRKRYEAEVAAAQREGRPVPAEPPEILVTDAQRAELDADAKARAEAYEIVKEDDEKKRAAKEYDDRVAQARALLATPRPQVEPAPADRVAPPPAEKGPVDIPDDWRTLSAPKRRSMAQRLGAPNTVTVEEADKKIEAEAQRRANERQVSQAAGARTTSMQDNRPPTVPESPAQAQVSAEPPGKPVS